MSFAYEVKAEVCKTALTRHCCAIAEAYGVLLYANSFSISEVRIVTENEEFAARLPGSFKRHFPSALTPCRRKRTAES